MDSLTLKSFVISSLLLFLYYAVKLFYFIWWKPKCLEKLLKRQGVRGTPYRLLFGDMKEYIRMITQAWSKPINLNHEIVQRVDPFTANNVHKYGKISMFWGGTTPRLIIMDSELMKEVLSNKLGHFQKPHINPLILVLTKGLTTLEGDKWANHRRIINPAFHMNKLKDMIPTFARCCGNKIEEWKNLASYQGTCEVDMWVELQDLTGDTISQAAFGNNYKEGKKILELQKELQVLVIEAMQTLYIPGFRYVPTKKNRRRRNLDKAIVTMLRNLIETKQISIANGQSKDDDLLGLLLQSNDQRNLSDHEKSTREGMTIEEVIEECKLFYLAGHETTSSLLTWAMIVLAMHPNWQEKAREEVLQVCAKKEPDFVAIGRLKILTMILNEVLRLYTPVIAHYQHVSKATKIGDICLPAGIDLILPTLLIHHDHELWGDDAGEFKPERFSEGVAKASKDQLSFFPFGWGPRTCIGQQFATIEAKVTLAMILQHFTFELSPSYTHAPYTTMFLQPQHGAHIILHQL